MEQFLKKYVVNAVVDLDHERINLEQLSFFFKSRIKRNADWTEFLFMYLLNSFFVLIW